MEVDVYSDDMHTPISDSSGGQLTLSSSLYYYHF